VVLASYLLPKLQSGELSRMIVVGTGAMMSPDSIKQGRAIPGIAHLIVLERPGG
jgi:stage V sporulation protein AD